MIVDSLLTIIHTRGQAAKTIIDYHENLNKFKMNDS